MKLTNKKLCALIEQEIKDAIDDKRPWYHGPFKSDWDRKQKAKECEEGDEEACHELEDEENRWNRIIAKFVGDPIEKIILKPKMLQEALREGKEAQTIYKIIKGWWSAEEIVSQIQGTWTTDSQYRKSGYDSNPMGSDEFFKTRYVGKKFKLEFLEWTMENRWRRKKYGQITDAISIAVTDIIMSKFPELKRLSDWGTDAGSKETSRIYPNTRNMPNYRFRPEIQLLVNAVMGNNLANQEQLVALLQKNIDGVRQLKSSGFDYEGKPPDDWRGYE